MTAPKPWMLEALAALERGAVVAAASESVFGLLADIAHEGAIERLLRVKSRSEEKGMPVLLPDRESWGRLVVEVPPLAAQLADAFWPGPLTIALPARPGLHERLMLGGSVAARLPGASPAAELARAFGRPLTGTSANPPGSAATASSDRIRDYFADAIRQGELVVVPDPGPGGSVSTVVVVRDGSVEIVRVGAISSRDVERAAR
jgi:L-threonylcarbamoyladenylate synthase